MNTKSRFFPVWPVLAALVLTCLDLTAASRDAAWKAVQDAIDKGLPKTAIEELEPIIKGALEDEAYGEATKAIARKIVLEGTIEGNKPEEKIVRMEDEISGAPAAMIPLLNTIQAHWYWHYFRQNRWRFIQRTATAEAPGEDFTTWDLPRLFARIDDHFTAALQAAPRLKEIPVSTFDELLEKGTLPDNYRPTLYDFIAHEALSFYTSGEQAAALPQDAYVLSAESPVLGSTRAFLDWRPMELAMAGGGDTNSPVLKAIGIYQDLLAFHENDEDQTAFLDVDLQRLNYGYNTAFGEIKNERYRSALERFVSSWPSHPLSALALHQWAQVVHGEDNLVEAHELATRGAESHPDSPGGKLCRNLVESIEARSIDLFTERVWNQPWPKITLRYRNITRVHFRAVAADWEEFLSRNRNRPDRLNNDERRALLREKAVLEWSEELPATEDYQERVAELDAPDSLANGFYFLIASHDPDFSEDDNQVSYTDVWVSDLALVMRPRNGQLEGFVLNAISGEPIFAADVQAWYLDRNRNRVALPATQSDDLGFFSLAPGGERNRGHLILVRHEGDSLASDQEYRSYPMQEADPYARTFFFTDRTLYRPGQTVRYKGICLRVDTEENNYRLLPGQKVTVVFSDPNGQEVSRHEHTCNDFGSFNGSVTAPEGRLNGNYSIRVDAGPDGSTRFNVEEYKRPKFEVTLQPPETAPRLEDEVTVRGMAEAYTGAAIDGATVQWRVVREIRWPYWWGWRHQWRMRGISQNQEIAHGTAQTDALGSFTIEFVAKPDPAVAEDSAASFDFRVHADVTDSSGETRSDQRSVQVGFIALSARLTADAWQTGNEPVELKIHTTTLDGEPQSVEGTVTVYRLQPPDRVHRPYLGEISSYFPGPTDEKSDLSNPEFWEDGETVFTAKIQTDAEGHARTEANLTTGAYRAILQTQDHFGKELKVPLQLEVIDPQAQRLDIRIPHLVKAPEWSAEPGEEFMAVWGTGYERGRAFIEVEHRHEMVQRYWTQPGRTQHQIEQAVTEAMRGGFHLHVTQVRENRAYLTTRKIEVPWTDKELNLRWEHFVSKLKPAQQETWTLVIEKAKTNDTNNAQEPDDVEHVAAELVAALYDESLDQFQPHSWIRRFGFFYQDHTSGHARFENMTAHFRHLQGRWDTGYVIVERTYRSFPNDLTVNVWNYGWALGRPARMRGMAVTSLFNGAAPAAEPALSLGEAADAVAGGVPATRQIAQSEKAEGETATDRAEASSRPDLSQVSARQNLNETAFFFPHLLSDANGTVRLQFTMPEALTRWKFMGFAHDKSLRSGFLEDHAVTSKDLMVQPNPPRFLREGDVLEFTVKISNQSPARQTGRVKLSFEFARSRESADAALGNTGNELEFDIPAKESRSYAWRIEVPDGCGFLTYKAVASTGRLSDGEEGYLPVLSRRIFVTESLPLPIRGPGTNEFEFTKLLQSGDSKTLRHHNLTVQMVSHPVWYAVLALPYLMEFPHECTEQTFNRLYANALARHIGNSDPKIRRIFDQWKNTPALESPLEKNQEIKAVMLEETPWLRQAKNESEARRNIGILFDANRLDDETRRTLRTLSEAQLDDGSWPWFPGGRGNDYITLYITTGFGRLRHLGLDLPVDSAVRSLQRLDNWMQEHYERIQKNATPEDYVPSPTDALYLYGRGFFLRDQPIAPQHTPAIRFFLERARDHWLKTAHRQSQAHLALALHRFNAAHFVNDADTPKAIMRSIKERSVTEEEMGMFWRDTEHSWWWYRAPIETQALMIEAFDEVMGDREAVEECRIWLLKQKQTQNWRTTKATADAVYSLLLRGTDLLQSDALVEVSVGNVDITPHGPALGQPLPPGRDPNAARNNPSHATVEAGTGFYEHHFNLSDIEPGLGKITVKKIDQGIAWGGVHWQYFEDMAKVTSHEQTPLKLKKSLYKKTNTERGPVLEPVDAPLAVGDELVVRIELRTDRDMEYVHMKDQRGSGTEPVNVISRYRFQDGLAYYEMTKDTASHFFIDYLPKGIYVFEYSTRIQHRGRYQTGMAQIQCMYAPEFNSHSASVPLVVQAPE